MPCAWNFIKRVQLVAAVVESDFLHGRFGAAIRKLFLIKRVVVAPVALELFKAITPHDSHGDTSGELRIVQTLRFSHPSLASYQYQRPPGVDF